MSVNDRAVLVDSSTNCVSNITSLCIPNISISGFSCNVAAITSSYSIQDNDDILIVNNVAGCTLTLPACDTGKVFYIKSTNVGSITIIGTMSETVDAELTQTLGQWDSITVVGVNVTETDWAII